MSLSLPTRLPPIFVPGHKAAPMEHGGSFENSDGSISKMSPGGRKD